MKIARTLIASITAGLLATSAFALTQPEYKAAKDTIEADYKASKEKCNALTDNAKDICVKEAKGHEDVAKAELEAQYKPSTKAAYKARVARADADYAIAKEKCARVHKVPYLGICLGMQVATIEYARHVAGLPGANSTEFDPSCKHPVIALITEWKDADGTIKTRDANSDLGGTMRLGAQSSDVAPGTLAHSIYGDVVTERHRHRYEANVNYLDQLRKAGLVISALTQREHLTEIVELPQNVHPWYIGVQFHPEFKSTPWNGHPLFNAFIKAAVEHQKPAAKA